MVRDIVEGEQVLAVRKGVFEDRKSKSSGMFYCFVTSPIIVLSIFETMQPFMNRLTCTMISSFDQVGFDNNPDLNL
jgi:hypothetical protein